MGFPQNEGVETPLGPAEYVWATSGTHVGVRGEFMVNRVQHRVRLDLHFRDGEWKRGDRDDWSSTFHALMVDRTDDFSGPTFRKKETSRSARMKVEQALVPWLAEYAVGDGAEMVREAEEAAQRSKITSAREKIATLKLEVEEAEESLRALLA